MRTTPWSRREFIANGVGGVAALRFGGGSYSRGAMAPEPACLLIEEQEEGPYYVDREILRKDITEGKRGVPLLLPLTLMDVKRCQPIENVAVDIWHCDALGNYSGYVSFRPGGPGGPNGPGRPGGPGGMPPPPPGSAMGERPQGSPPMDGPPKMQPTDKEVFLRGVQLTDAKGLVEFATIYPGCYIGRVNHIHLKAHIGGHSEGSEYQGGHVAHTGQIFFPEEITNGVLALEPYSRHEIQRTTLADDRVFNTEHGSQSVARLAALKEGSPLSGYVASVTLWVDPDATPAPNRPAPPRGL